MKKLSNNKTTNRLDFGVLGLGIPKEPTMSQIMSFLSLGFYKNEEIIINKTTNRLDFRVLGFRALKP